MSLQLPPKNPTLSAVQQQVHKRWLNLAKPSTVLHCDDKDKNITRDLSFKSMCEPMLPLLWSQMYWLHVSPGATWGTLLYEQKRQLAIQLPFLKPRHSWEWPGQQSIRQPSPWRALTGHVEGDNPLSSPSFVHRFTFVQSGYIGCLDNKGTYSLRKKQIPGHKQWRLCLCTCIQTKSQHPHHCCDLPMPFRLQHWPRTLKSVQL